MSLYNETENKNSAKNKIQGENVASLKFDSSPCYFRLKINMCWVLDSVDPLRLLQRDLSPFVYKRLGEDGWSSHGNDPPSISWKPWGENNLGRNSLLCSSSGTAESPVPPSSVLKVGALC